MNESAVYEIRLKDSFSSPLAGLERKMDSFESKLGSIGKTALGVFGGSFLAGGVQGVLEGVKDLAFGIVKLGADMEQTRVSFTTMLGSAEKANDTIQELRKFAEATPFSQNEVVTGAKQMLAFGFQAESLTSNLSMLGDVSAGLNIPIGDMIYLFGTLKTQGRAMTKDIMQFAQRGIPIYDELAKVLGINKDQVGKFLEDGKVTFDHVNKAFQNMTKQGSMFGGLMEKQSKTLAGRWSTFQDKLESMGTSLGEKLLPTLGKALDFVTSIVEVIPQLDFSPLLYTFTQLGEQIGYAFSIWKDLINSFGASFTTLDALTVALRYVAYLFRVAFTPIRVAIQLYTHLITMIKESYGLLQGLGNLFAGIFTKDFAQAGKGIDQIKTALSSMGSEMAKHANTFIHDEKEGWKKIFAPLSEAEGSSFADGLGGNASNNNTTSSAAGGKDKTAGVEKISSGTRNVTVNITTLKLADNIVSNKADMSDVRVQDMLKRALLTAINDVNIVAD